MNSIYTNNSEDFTEDVIIITAVTFVTVKSALKKKVKIVLGRM